MRPKEDNPSTRKNKHLNWEERIQIEALHRADFSAVQIARHLGRSERTIRRELKRGWVLYRTSRYSVQERYNAQRAQVAYEQRCKGSSSLNALNKELVEYIRVQVVEYKASPAVIAFRLKKDMPEEAVCFKTIYNLIDRNQIPGVSNAHLWEKHARKRSPKGLDRKRKRAIPPGRSIENRSEAIRRRNEIGHWEIDLVVGGKGKGSAVLLTLTERKTRKLIMRKLRNKTQQSIIRALNGIERQMGRAAFRVIFKSITADNGSEFLDTEALEASVFGGKRTHIYYAHPYASWERGSNEHVNRMIRRFIPKGCDISVFTPKQIKAIESWINNYPRKILNFKTAEEEFRKELSV
jgi:IS30 family transposase